MGQIAHRFAAAELKLFPAGETLPPAHLVRSLEALLGFVVLESPREETRPVKDIKPPTAVQIHANILTLICTMNVGTPSTR